MANDLSYHELLRGLEGLTVRRVLSSANGWLVDVDGPRSATCPHCAMPSRSRHSSYRRRLRDLPLQGVSVTLDLRVGRWRCHTPQCQRRIFTERLPGVLEPYARQTKLLAETRTVVSRALGGRPGARLLWRLGMPVSRHTLLRQLKQAARHSAPPTVRVLGVDDWAWKKGMSFGTILVDLERNEVVDVLPTRSAEVLSVWLSQHPGVEILGRDRQGEYAEGARQGAPDAVQVADRFHLQLNLRQAVERALAVQRQHLRLPASSVALPATSRPALAEEAPQDRWMRVRSRVCQQEAEAAWQRRQQQLELFETVRGMKAAGLYVSQIAAHLGVNRRRLDRWLRLDALPERHRMEPRPGMAESFRDYLRQRWEAGQRHGRTLFAEIQELGYRGSYSHLAKLLSPWRQPKAANAAPPLQAKPAATLPALPVGRQISPQVAAALMSKNPTELSGPQAEIVAALKKQCPGFAVMRSLALSFGTILQRGKVATLHRWMEAASKTGIQAMERFVRTLRQDLGAVEAAVREPWSNGPVEGQINRLKTLKRQMYGRAGVELLRARLLPEPPSLVAR